MLQSIHRRKDIESAGYSARLAARSGEDGINGQVKNQRDDSGNGSSVEAAEACTTHRDCVAGPEQSAAEK